MGGGWWGWGGFKGKLDVKILGFINTFDKNVRDSGIKIKKKSHRDVITRDVNKYFPSVITILRSYLGYCKKNPFLSLITSCNLSLYHFLVIVKGDHRQVTRWSAKVG